MASPKSKKKSRGRRIMEMKYIEDETVRSVTFSKRRAGLFKKAAELSIVCGAQIALIVFSLCGRAYSFGHPTVSSVINRFLNRPHVPTLLDYAEGRRIHAETIQELTEKCEQASAELEKTKKKAKELEAALEDSPCQTSEEALSKLDIDQLKDLKKMMENLHTNLQRRVDEEKSLDVAAPEVQEKVAVDLSNIRRVGSPIPPDWLKL